MRMEVRLTEWTGWIDYWQERSFSISRILDGRVCAH